SNDFERRPHGRTQRQPKRLFLHAAFHRRRLARVSRHSDCFLSFGRADSRRNFYRSGDAILKNSCPFRCAAGVHHLDSLFAAAAWYACFVKGMNGSAALDRQSSTRATVWKATLIAIPIVTLLGLIWLRQLEVNVLRQRTVSSYGTVPEFTLTNQDGKTFGS